MCSRARRAARRGARAARGAAARGGGRTRRSRRTPRARPGAAARPRGRSRCLSASSASTGGRAPTIAPTRAPGNSDFENENRCTTRPLRVERRRAAGPACPRSAGPSRRRPRSRACRTRAATASSARRCARTVRGADRVVEGRDRVERLHLGPREHLLERARDRGRPRASAPAPCAARARPPRQHVVVGGLLDGDHVARRREQAQRERDRPGSRRWHSTSSSAPTAMPASRRRSASASRSAGRPAARRRAAARARLARARG